MKKLSFFLLLILSGCGVLVDPADSDPRFEPIKKQFEKDAAAFGIAVDTSSISIAFGDTQKSLKYAGIIPITKNEGPAYGYCLVLGKTNNDLEKPLVKLALGKKHLEKRIVISDELRSFPVEDIEATVYHELGHCALGLSHSNTELIMNPLFNGNLKDFRYFLLEELFKRKRNMPRTLTKISNAPYTMDLIYEADYVLFEKHIFYQLYYDSLIERYFFRNEIYNDNNRTITREISAAASRR
jgi:predicted Zn-dependent protease